jgi:hypothetical protein
MELCNPCPVNNLEITEGQLAAGWCRLVLNNKTREKLASAEFAAFDSPAARASTDPAIRKTVTGRAIALCLQRHAAEVPSCPLTALYQYAHIDNPELPVNL